MSVLHFFKTKIPILKNNHFKKNYTFISVFKIIIKSLN